MFQPAPKPTTFNGVTYRSRLEAKWAVQFWLAKTPAVYEGYEFKQPNGWKYTPDFYLPGAGTIHRTGLYLEIKPNYPSDEYLNFIAGFNLDLPLYFGVGSFYRSRPLMFELVNQPDCLRLKACRTDMVFPNCTTGVVYQATKWRFDLRS